MVRNTKAELPSSHPFQRSLDARLCVEGPLCKPQRSGPFLFDQRCDELAGRTPAFPAWARPFLPCSLKRHKAREEPSMVARFKAQVR